MYAPGRQMANKEKIISPGPESWCASHDVNKKERHLPIDVRWKRVFLNPKTFSPKLTLLYCIVFVYSRNLDKNSIEGGFYLPESVKKMSDVISVHRLLNKR